MTIDRFKEMNEKAKLYDDLREGLEQAIELTKEESKKNEKHLKGYIYDSLVYRYKFALEMATEARAESMYCMGTGKYINKHEAIAAARKQNERDIIKFCQILEEAIGERD